MKLAIGDAIKCIECKGTGEKIYRSIDANGTITERVAKICWRCRGQGEINWWNCTEEERK